MIILDATNLHIGDIFLLYPVVQTLLNREEDVRIIVTNDVKDKLQNVLPLNYVDSWFPSASNHPIQIGIRRPGHFTEIAFKQFNLTPEFHPPIVLPENIEARSWAEELLPSGPKYALISPDAGHMMKRMSISFWLDIIEMCEEYGYVPVVVSPPDYHLNKEISYLTHCKDISARSAEHNFGYLIERADIVISTDTGFGHFADAMGKYTLSCFALDNEDRFHPYNNPIVVKTSEQVRHALEAHRDVC